VLGDRRVEVTVDEHLGTTRLPAHIEVALFRIVQEAVTNVARHAGAKHAMIHLARTNGTVMVQVSDDGKGFDVGAAMGPKSQPESVGLVGMQERVALLNGSMEVASKRDSGTTVTVRIQAGDAVP
jgi:signal transduction histidine kinase